jgi:hypothetical protein
VEKAAGTVVDDMTDLTGKTFKRVEEPVPCTPHLESIAKNSTLFSNS